MGGIDKVHGSLHNTAKLANVDFFGSVVKPSAGTPTHIRIQVCLSAEAVLTAKVRKAEADAMDHKLNGGAALLADVPYIFDLLLDAGWDLNLQASVNVTVRSCLAVELVGAA